MTITGPLETASDAHVDHDIGLQRPSERKPRSKAIELRTVDGCESEDAFCEQVEVRLNDLLTQERERWGRQYPDVGVGLDALTDFVLNGGKRLRPRFLFWGQRAVAPEPHFGTVDVGAAIELLHAFALIHDDIMDGSDTRRHRPTMHRRYEERHRIERWSGEQRRTGEGFAILLGDLAFAYSVRLLCGIPEPTLRLFDEMRIELHVGQYLDLACAASTDVDQFSVDSVALFKTAKYTVERPLLLGASLDEGQHLDGVLSTYGLSIGKAFQLRDDLLGTFGDPSVTGKSDLEDLRAGKRTVLAELLRQHSDAPACAAIARIGRPDFDGSDAESIREFAVQHGIVAMLESQIEELTETAVSALQDQRLDNETRQGLTSLAGRCSWRNR